jgi:hypothetical protein
MYVVLSAVGFDNAFSTWFKEDKKGLEQRDLQKPSTRTSPSSTELASMISQFKERINQHSRIVGNDTENGVAVIQFSTEELSFLIIDPDGVKGMSAFVKAIKENYTLAVCDRGGRGATLQKRKYHGRRNLGTFADSEKNGVHTRQCLHRGRTLVTLFGNLFQRGGPLRKKNWPTTLRRQERPRSIYMKEF